MLPERPTIYVGLGTSFNQPEVFRALLVGLRDEPLTLIVTVGRDQDPADYRPQPANVHLEWYIPLFTAAATPAHFHVQVSLARASIGGTLNDRLDGLPRWSERS